MRNTRLAGYRRETIGAARGRVLEIGIGSGLNLPIYGAAVDQVCGIDSSPGLLDRASKRMGDAHIHPESERCAGRDAECPQTRRAAPPSRIVARLAAHSMNFPTC